METKEYLSCCIMCGAKIMVDKDTPRQLCGNEDCLRNYAEEFECYKCGTSERDFIKRGGMSMGQVTIWNYSCPNHEKVNFKRHSFYKEIKICPECNHEVMGEIGIEFLEQEGYCLSCDKQKGDAQIAQREGSIEDE